MIYRIVIARYSETDTLNRLLSHKFISDSCIIYNKGDSLGLSNEILIPNDPIFTRESDCYLKFIIDSYKNLPDYIFFTQADPFDHSPGYIQLLKKFVVEKKYKPNHYQPMTWCWKEAYGIPAKFFIDYNNLLYIDEYRIYMETIYDSLLPIGYRDFGMELNLYNFRKLHNIIDPNDTLKYIHTKLKLRRPYIGFIMFNYGAIFGVSKQRILTNSLDHYKELREFLYQDKSHGYILERLWFTIFN